MTEDKLDMILEGEKPIIFDCLNDSVEKLIKYIEQAGIIYIGELHDEISHYQTEFDVIRTVSQKYKIQIAMEEFNSAEQKDIDDYLSGKLKCYSKASEVTLLQHARKYGWKVIAIDKPGNVDFQKPETVGSEREKHWAKILIPHLNNKVKTVVIAGQSHFRKYFGFPIRLARQGFDKYVIVELK